MSQDIVFVVRFNDKYLSILAEIELRKWIGAHAGKIEDVKVYNEDGSEYTYIEHALKTEEEA